MTAVRLRPSIVVAAAAVAVALSAAGCGDGDDGGEASGGPLHGAGVAETNCPDTDRQRIEASAFSFSVPSDFVDQAPRVVDSEVGRWSGDSCIVDSIERDRG